jgi:Zn-dependent peptidase ImmA (M78 family)
MVDPHERWERWRQTMQSAGDRRTATRTLREISTEVADALEDHPSLASEWAPIGLEIECKPLAASGLCVRGTRRIVVRSRDSAPRKRYTVAHELAHLLLAHAAESAGLRFGCHEEERLCERFAGEVLVPRELLTEYLQTHPPAPSLEWLSDAADHFGVSLSAVTIALGELRWDGSAAYLLARNVGHPKRPDQKDLRIASAAAPDHLWLPRHKRLRSLGWGALVDWAAGKEPGAMRRDQDAQVVFPAGPAAPRGTAGWKGVVPSEAMVIAGAYRVVMALDVGELRPKQRHGRRRAVSTAQEGQLAFTIA